MFQEDVSNRKDIKVHIQELNIVNIIIISYIILIAIFLIKGLAQLDFWEVFSGIFLLFLALIPNIFKSESLFDLEHQQTKLKEQISTLKLKIAAAKGSLL